MQLQAPPPTFEFVHLIVILLAAAIVYYLQRVIKRSKHKMVRIGSSAFSGLLTGLIGAYLLAHIATPIVYGNQPAGMKSMDGGYGMLFWALFMGLSAIAAIGGGLVGIMIHSKREVVNNDGDE